MKKFFLVLFCFFSVFIYSITITVAVDDPFDSGDKDEITTVKDSKLPYGGNIHLYKVTLYKHKDGLQQKKTNGYNSFERINSIFYYNNESKVRNNAKVLLYDKFYYVNEYIQRGRMESVPLEYTTFGNVNKRLYNFPSFGVDVVKGDAVEKYFKDNESLIRTFVNDLKGDKQIGFDKDTWALLIEPIIVCSDTATDVHYYFTATEHALAYEKVKGSTNTIKDGYYNPYCDKSPGIYSINYVCNRLYVKDGYGNWLGLSDDGRVNASWDFKKIGLDPYYWGSRSRKDWELIKDDIVRHGGVGIFFSQAFELPDYTGSLKVSNSNPYEQEKIDVTATISRSNSPRGGTVNVVLKYKGAKVAETTVDFSNTEAESISRTWKINVGNYSQKDGADANKLFEMTFEATGDVQDINSSNNNSDKQKKWITLKRDMAISAVSLDRTNVFENDEITARFTIKNNNPYWHYDNVPVTVFLVDELNYETEVGKTTVNLGKEEQRTCSLKINVGSVRENDDQTDKIVAVLNSTNVSGNRSAYHEANMGNNKGSGTFIVKRIIDLAVKIIKPNKDFSDYSASAESGGVGTQAVTSCLVYNMSRFNLFKGNQMDDTITVTLYVNGAKAASSKRVDIPANSSNLVWFKWDVPKSPGTVTLEVRISWSVNQEYHPNISDNESDCTATVKHVGTHSTPDTSLIKTKARDYMDASSYVRRNPYVSRWSCYKYEGGRFVKYDYALSAETWASLSPLKTEVDGNEYANGSNYMAGSGFSIDFRYDIVGECRTNTGTYNTEFTHSENDFTYIQNADASFPEFKYTRAESVGNFRTVYFNSNASGRRFRFAPNSAADDGQRVHFTPVNMPDGIYKVAVVGYDLWTPAGMIYVNASPAINITDSVYNEHYVS